MSASPEGFASVVMNLLKNVIHDLPKYGLRIGKSVQTNSLVGVTQSARVEPLTVVSRDLIHYENMTEILSSLLNIFTGYYLQAISLSTKIDNVRVIKVLDRLNPDRQFGGILELDQKIAGFSKESYFEKSLSTNMLGHYDSNRGVAIECYKFRLPTSFNKPAIESEIHRLRNSTYVSVENSDAIEANKKTFKKIEKGAFHKWLGKKEGDTITDADIEKGLASKDPHVKRMAQFAKNSKKFKHTKNKTVSTEGYLELADMKDYVNSISLEAAGLNDSAYKPYADKIAKELEAVQKEIETTIKSKNELEDSQSQIVDVVERIRRQDKISELNDDLQHILNNGLSKSTAEQRKIDALVQQIEKETNELNKFTANSNNKVDSSKFQKKIDELKETEKALMGKLESVNAKMESTSRNDTVQTVSDKSLDIVNELSNLSVGKLVNVTIVVNDKAVTIPVNIRLSVTTIPNDSILHILALKKEDNTLRERFHAWRAGNIEFIRDLMLCQDLIDEHKKALMNDEHGTYTEIIKRVNNCKKYGALSNNPSLVSASNLFVISEEVAKDLERTMMGKLSNPRVRDLVFDNTYAMILVVIDREYERVTFYHRGISQATEVSIKDIKNSNKSKGADITDVMKQLMSGSAPSF